MTDDAFLTTLQKITAGSLELAELIGAVTGLIDNGQASGAQQLYAVWANFNPGHPQLYVAHFNRAAVQSQIGDHAAAAESLNKALALNPEFLPAYINLGGVLEKCGLLDAAVEQWKAVVGKLPTINPGSIRYKLTALQQIARVFAEHQHSESAELALREALGIDPRQREALEQFLALRLNQCKWPVVEPWEGVDRKTLLGGLHPLSVAAYTDDPLMQLGAAARYIEEACDENPDALTHDRRDAVIETKRRLRIGYVSSDLRDHAVGYLMAEVFELHDRNQVEVFAYYCGKPSTEPLNLRLRASAEHWADITELSDAAAAALIAGDGIDILVDVNGHTRDGRTGVFARRPAPVQVNWLGYPGTMGSPYHHYVIADPWIIPPELEHYYSETVVRLPCYQPNDRKRVVAAEVPTRREAGLPDGAVVFCCFNGSQKITRFTFERWMDVLKRVPGSVLWLLQSTAATQARLLAAAELMGVARQRLVFAPRQGNAQHLARYALADLFLDTAPYGAHTTASDALWMGVPVLTLSGRSFASRVCGSLVRSAGLPDLVCLTPQEYVERAVALGLDRPGLEAHRAKLQAGRNSCVLFDMDALVSRLEQLYGDMAEAHRCGRTPEPQLLNADRYFAVGLETDHEAQEVLAIPDYDAWVRAKLARQHRMRPVPPDTRLWTAEAIATAERPPSGSRPEYRRAVGD